MTAHFGEYLRTHAPTGRVYIDPSGEALAGDGIRPRRLRAAQLLADHADEEPEQRCRDEALALSDHPTMAELDGLVPHLSYTNRSPRSRHAYTLHVISGRGAYPTTNWLQRTTPPRGF